VSGPASILRWIVTLLGGHRAKREIVGAEPWRTEVVNQMVMAEAKLGRTGKWTRLDVVAKPGQPGTVAGRARGYVGPGPYGTCGAYVRGTARRMTMTLYVSPSGQREPGEIEHECAEVVLMSLGIKDLNKRHEMMRAAGIWGT
jgi:hypothetical protein